MVEREGRWVSRERSQCCRRQRGRSCTAPTSASLRLWERLEGGGRTGDVDVDVDVETERRRRRGAVEGCSLAHTLSSKCMQDREIVGVGGGGRRRQRRDRDYLPEPRVPQRNRGRCPSPGHECDPPHRDHEDTHSEFIIYRLVAVAIDNY